MYIVYIYVPIRQYIYILQIYYYTEQIQQGIGIL